MNNNNYEQRPQQRLLAFDTSTSSLAVAVMEDGRLLAERSMHAERDHSSLLVTAIGECLDAAGLSKRDLTGIAVGAGPGSYTGIRIAVTTAKTLAWALRLPVYGVSSLEALALGGWAGASGQDAAKLGAWAAPAAGGAAGHGASAAAITGAAAANGASDAANGIAGAPAEAAALAAADRRYAGGHWIVPLVDARRGQAYTALFAVPAAGGWPQRLAPDAIRLTDGWAGELSKRLTALEPHERPAAVWFVGETAKHEAALGQLRSGAMPPVHLVPYELEGVWMGMAGVKRVRTYPEDEVHSLEPNYTQLAEAEAKRLRNG
ncbi:tRNA (adenosine(37)-N6)-threonylcarbamoyltransferase complex dimerization subunit type 1 TsaB [Paenibacillus oralis]|uniref:tRNA (Adenosine(37)-N6)-threonylcarbamoyltransferase complex dimerization subunit type 1 TsaB n=1 Tax=Paenibacillus oralis TaxID=2490856 RepID=A0A3P3U293_9BACL|nr:tRNA (adenosine(37)-N6)-threonylcarbamoyltransferase complex dimerization subunit type 1 TsaB [Paenibacillus oralis]RRJ64240.1 tRNA (adenosine(37)-N6)-threonylcarbamoyltransferase complex dimerization subunit type 1 TsaB [Paenibacillus oralis]